MGAFSFCILIILQIEAHFATGVLDPYISMFELAHVWLFGVGTLYAGHAIVFSFRMAPRKREWDRSDNMSPAQIADCHARPRQPMWQSIIKGPDQDEEDIECVESQGRTVCAVCRARPECVCVVWRV